MFCSVGTKNHKSIFTIDSEHDKKGFYNKSIMVKINKLFIQQPSTIDCQLSVNESNYMKKKQFLFYGEFSTLILSHK